MLTDVDTIQSVSVFDEMGLGSVSRRARWISLSHCYGGHYIFSNLPARVFREISQSASVFKLEVWSTFKKTAFFRAEIRGSGAKP